MYLKSMEIQGFKSFADKTVLQFGSDITAIVGPNGSGKSNISDAISWVMGEMSTKALRGSKMEDVIFGGTQKRSQVGFAEASLILDNSDGALRIETPEVMVTRRYYRSGESEYYINKQSARLRDIVELFMDTGLGKEGYSNIGQGRIDEILAVKSTDRREVFEEAAGISKYRHRKEETERRLANTEDNLMRVGDKISELELQVEPLRVQAEKARKYLAYRDEMKGLEVTVWLDSLERLAAAAKKAEEDYAQATRDLEDQHAELTRLYQQSEQLAMEVNRDGLELDRRREEISEMEGSLHQKDADRALLEAGKENLQNNILRIRQEMEEQESRSGGIAGQIAQQQERILVIGEALTDIHHKLQQAAEESQRLTASSDAWERKALGLRAAQGLLQSEAAGKRADIAALTASVEEVSERRNAITEDLTAAKERRQELHGQYLEYEKELNEAKETVTSCQNSAAGYALRQKSRTEKRDQLQEQVNQLGIQLQTSKSRLQMLREMERDYEGFSKAVRLVMQEAAKKTLGTIYGPVSSLIRTEDDYTVAVETALGGALQNVVVATEAEGKAAIRFLKRCDGGRTTFLPLNTIKGRTLQEKGLEKCTGFIGLASELVKYDSRYEGIVRDLLGRTVIVENLDHAVNMARSFQSRFKIVTLDGQVMNAGGSMTGGSASRSAGILSRANEKSRLEEQERKLTAKLSEQQTQLAEAERAAAQVEFEMTALQGQLRQAEDNALRAEGHLEQSRLLLQALDDNIASYEKELQQLESRSSGDEGKLKLLREDVRKAEEESARLEAELETISGDQAALGKETEELSDRITALRLDMATQEAERSSIQENIQRLKVLEEAMQGDRSQKEALISQYEEEIAGLEQQAEQVLQQRTEMEQTLEKFRLDLQKALEKRANMEARRTKTEKDAQEKSRQIVDMEREAARLEQKKNSATMEEQQILDKLWDSYELTPGTAAEARVEIESTTAAQRSISDLKRKISGLGTPNLGAIEEFARVNERYEYLTGQRDDVLHAKKELEAIIRTITTEMTEIFVREFEKINTYFSQTFVEMFGGGKGELVLENPEEPLSCGIEIRVQPPGKQLKTITLLSGGEKAFVAIALYFAILRVRPTPFCLLDEIDAALDDRNVERFSRYLRNLCGKTQFIVITHRRGTMEQADVLYGVTMQEQGVSKILHLDLNHLQQELGITD